MQKNLLVELRKKIAKTLFNFAEVTTTDGIVIVYEGEQVVEGIEVNTYAEDGSVTPLSNGTYVIDDITSITVEDGKVTKVEVKEEMEKTAEDIVEDIVEEIPKEDNIAPQLEPFILDLVTAINNLKEEIKILKSNLTSQEEKLNKFSIQPIAHPATVEIEDKENYKFDKTNKAAQRISKINN